ncbi:hypothetical protein Leryth_003441 [Lithospermum erythrorhizon]|nr:hypothetical protein Leryth_003441 [Lithospermum erythrorhizon]
MENSFAESATPEAYFRAPFTIDELRQLDFALEGVPFQQLFRMPCSPCISDHLKEEEYLALEDFMHTIASGLWHTFWHKNKPFPCSISCPRHPGSRFYTVEKAIARRRLETLSGVALMSKPSSHLHWDDIVEFALFKPDIMMGNELGLSSSIICQALFYGIHILLSQSLNKQNAVASDSVFILVVDSRCGGVVKLEGDFSKLEIDLNDPYNCIAEWIKCHADVKVSPVDRIWNKLGNANWGDFGTLQLLLATFYSLEQWHGPPRRSISSLAAKHMNRLQQRRMECFHIENETDLVHSQEHTSVDDGFKENHHVDHQKHNNQHSHLMLQQGEVLSLEDQHQDHKSFQIQDSMVKDYSCSYIAVAIEFPEELLSLYIGAHPSRLGASLEDMNLWYKVQRQTKVLNILKEQGISSKHLPQIVASGRVLHPGHCEKQSPKGLCDHPWCGKQILVTYPLGEPLSSIVAHDGPLSSEDAIRCCRDCLAALRSAKMANIQHGDICPDNILRVVDEHRANGEISYILVSWGRAVLEDRDSPAINLQFSSAYALQHGKLCPSSDAESLIYLIFFLCGGTMQQQDSIESALLWKQTWWAERRVQQLLGEVSPILKAFADYIGNLCSTPYPVDYDVWVKRLGRTVDSSPEKGKTVESLSSIAMTVESLSSMDIAESSRTSGGAYSS